MLDRVLWGMGQTANGRNPAAIGIDVISSNLLLVLNMFYFQPSSGKLPILTLYIYNNII